MALRKIREMGDSVLNKVCKSVDAMTERTSILIDDMLDTMYEAEGVGLAAPQVGVLKRIVVVDVDDGNGPYILINPRVIEMDGQQADYEGCLSIPGKVGKVTRAQYVKVLALDRDMKPIEVVGTDLLARAFLHEIDHLDGILYAEKAEGGLVDSSELVREDEDEYDDDEE